MNQTTRLAALSLLRVRRRGSLVPDSSSTFPILVDMSNSARQHEPGVRKAAGWLHVVRRDGPSATKPRVRYCNVLREQALRGKNEDRHDRHAGRAGQIWRL